MSAGRLAGKVALITGGTSGIGAATTEAFVRAGARVLFTGRNEDRAHALAERIGNEVCFEAADVRRDEDCRRTVDAALDRFGALDILFNNAGIVTFGNIDTTADAVWADTFATNVTGVFHMCRAAMPHLRNGGGSIVNNASDWGLVGGRDALAYTASKGAVVLLTKSLALDHAREGVRVNAVCPGDTYVERWRERSDPHEDFAAELTATGAAIPMGRVGEAAEIAQAVLYLASDDASYVTGQCLVVDGGNTAGGAATAY